MAEFCRAQTRQITRGCISLLGVLGVVVLAAPCTFAQTLYKGPVLVTELGMHTAKATAAINSAGRFIVTGSRDKTVRIWSASNGELLRTIRMPSGPDWIGAIFAVALSPDGENVAAGGWTGRKDLQPVYMFERATGRMLKLIPDLPGVAVKLTYSKDGRYLAAGLGGRFGLRIFDHDRNWEEVSRDESYGGDIYGVSFADDGRLVTSSTDGIIRLYDASFAPVASVVARTIPREIAFSPDGAAIAVGYYGAPAVDLFDSRDLSRLAGPDTNGLDNGMLDRVAWSADGQTLFAGGTTFKGDDLVLLAWDKGGHGTQRALAAKCAPTENSFSKIATMPTGEVLIVKGNPCLAMITKNGDTLWALHPPIADFRDQADAFAVSADGTIVDFLYEEHGKSLFRFNLNARTLTPGPPDDGRTVPAKKHGIAVVNWRNSLNPQVNWKWLWLNFQINEMSRDLAVHPDGRRFVLGCDFSLRAFDAAGKELWMRPTPGANQAWDVNITSDGRLVVVAYADGTIRWHRMSDGFEILALQVLSDKKNWVAWTPEGFYDATPGAFGVLRWHVNRHEAAGDALPVSSIPLLKRPDALPLVLQELETVRALGIADLSRRPLCSSSLHRRGDWTRSATARSIDRHKPLR